MIFTFITQERLGKKITLEAILKQSTKTILNGILQ